MTIAFSFTEDGPAARDAATVLVVRDGPRGPEVFMVKRAAAVRFMGGAYVFPGGRVDAEDAAPDVPCDLDAAACAARLAADEPAKARALHVAALRECVEESGIVLAAGEVRDGAGARLRAALEGGARPSLASLLAREGLTLACSALMPWSRWVTPRQETKRFDARFFLARAPESAASAVHDGGETVASEWLRPADAVARALAGEIVLAPPTWRTLAEIASATSVASLLTEQRAPVLPLEPVVRPFEDTLAVLLPDDREHPRAVSVQGPSLPTRFIYRDGTWELGFEGMRG